MASEREERPSTGQRILHILAVVVSAAALAVPGSAFFLDGTSSGHINSAASITANFPAGIQAGDLAVDIVFAATNTPIATPTGWTEATAIPFNGSPAADQCSIWTHPYAAGDPTPVFSVGGSTSLAYIGSAYYGVNAIDQVQGQATTGATWTAPSVPTPAVPNEELLLAYCGAGNSAITATPSLVTAGSTTLPTPAATPSFGSAPTLVLYQANLGPSAVATPGSVSITASPAAASAGIQMTLKPPGFPPGRPALGTSRLQNSAGNYYFLSAPPATFDITGLSQPWLDGLALYSTWKAMEPACEVFNWDYTDNMILNAEALGLTVSLGVGTGNQTVNPIPSTGDASQAPAWAFSPSSCDASATPRFITSSWVKPKFGPVMCSENQILDPGDSSGYQAEWATGVTGYPSFISQVGSRYGGLPNIVQIKATGIGKDTAETNLNNGSNLQVITSNCVPEPGGNCGTLSAVPGVTCTPMMNPTSCTCTITDKSDWFALDNYSIGTFDLAMESAQETFSNAWSAAFPKAIVGFDSVAPPALPPGTFPTPGTDPFDQILLSWYSTNLPGKGVMINGGLGCVPSPAPPATPTACSGSPPIFTAPYLYLVNYQPGLMYGYQTVSVQGDIFTAGTDVTGCDDPAAHFYSAPLFSTSVGNCLTPDVFAALRLLMTPNLYFEWYPGDIDTSALTPWFELVHEKARSATGMPGGLW